MRILLRSLCAVLLALSCIGPLNAGNGADAEIDGLIARVAQARQVVFIRNGSEHTAAEAAAHLRLKRRAAHAAFGSAEQFIDAVGTRSSLSGRAYRVRTADGREVDSAVWLRGLLRELRATRLRVPPPAAAGAPSPAPAGR